MRNAVLARALSANVIIQAAAIADYRPATTAARKLKKEDGLSAIPLVATEDVSIALGLQKSPGQMLIGFAAETENLLENARRKLVQKNLDWIVANDVTAEGAGFDVETNIVTLLGADGREIALPLLSKQEVADKILDTIRPA
jgi:phosphopantothenoylcysteine decarboxylase/phosphopantothenate--cysteine ligase